MNILLIEDDADSVLLLTDMLEREGHAVRVRGHILPAFEMLRRGGTDLILMDIGLPRMNGLEFTRRLRSYDAFRAIPVIAVSGMPQTVMGEAARSAGCDAYVEKPIVRRELLDAIAALPARPRRAPSW